MRGSPLFRTALVLFAFLLLLLPLRSLTSSRINSAPAVAPLPAAIATVQLTITSTSVPFSFEISDLGKTVWKGESNESSISKSLTLPFPPEGVDLVVQASWPVAKESAVRIEAARDGSAPITRTLWGTDHVNDVVTFAPPP